MHTFTWMDVIRLSVYCHCATFVNHGPATSVRPITCLAFLWLVFVAYRKQQRDKRRACPWPVCKGGFTTTKSFLQHLSACHNGFVPDDEALYINPAASLDLSLADTGCSRSQTLARYCMCAVCLRLRGLTRQLHNIA